MDPNPDRQNFLARIETLKQEGEKAYDEMYDAHGDKIDACYHEAKISFEAALELAREPGLEEEAKALSARWTHIRAVYRHQFRA